MSPGIRADGRRNRERILEAGAALLQRSPHATMNEVAQAAGLTRATLYRHFADREALLDSLVEELARGLRPGLFEHLDGLTLPDAMAALATVIADMGEQHRNLVITISGRLNEVASQAAPDGLLNDFFRRRREAGELRADQSEDWLASCVRSVCLMAVTRQDPPDVVRRDLTQALQRLVG